MDTLDDPSAVTAAPPFDATDPAFVHDPYPFYARLRTSSPVCRVAAPYKAWWVFSHALVKEACARPDLFLKPGGARAPEGRPADVNRCMPDGLFFMNPPRHTEVRALLEPVMQKASADVGRRAAQLARRAVEDALRTAEPLEIRKQFAAKVAGEVFMEIFDLPSGLDRVVADRWIRSALDAHDKTLPAELRGQGFGASMALRAYLLARGEEVAASLRSGVASRPDSIMADMQRLTACPVGKRQLHPYESMNSAVHFALGGYLSTEFLIASGVYNLLRHPEQWAALRGDKRLLDKAVQEMLRFDAPFQVAERWVDREVELGRTTIPKDSMVTLVYGSANRDEVVYTDPDRFDITREQPPHNLGFGDGIHVCIGRDMATAVAKAALEALIDLAPGMTLADDRITWARDPYFRTPVEVLVALR